MLVKGVLRADDALRCANACRASSDRPRRGSARHAADATQAKTGAPLAAMAHGGRHLDATVATADALPAIAAAIGARAEVYVDGGIRRGTDIVKALALGARAVLLGRPPLWGLSVDGADGVRMVMDHMRDEMVRAMQLCGAASLKALTPDLVKA